VTIAAFRRAISESLTSSSRKTGRHGSEKSIGTGADKKGKANYNEWSSKEHLLGKWNESKEWPRRQGRIKLAVLHEKYLDRTAVVEVL
jgi:hypothetical protein